MRAAAAAGNFALTRSIFRKNFDSASACRRNKLSIGRGKPTIECFRSLMVAFKNEPIPKFEQAFEAMDMLEAYGFIPDAGIYNIMMRACETGP